MNNSKILLIFTCFFTISCSERPTFQELTTNFVKNETAFGELSDVVCSIGSENSSYSFEIPTHSSNSSEENDPDFVINTNVERLLQQISASSVVYESLSTGQCNLTVLYFLRGFSSSGMVYTYEFQKQDVNLVENDEKVIDEIIDKNLQTTIDVKLNRYWYFTVKRY